MQKQRGHLRHLQFIDLFGSGAFPVLWNAHSRHAFIDRALAKILKLPPRLFRQCRCIDVLCSPARIVQMTRQLPRVRSIWSFHNLPSKKRSVIFAIRFYLCKKYLYLFKFIFITLRCREQLLLRFLKHHVIWWIFYVKLGRVKYSFHRVKWSYL